MIEWKTSDNFNPQVVLDEIESAKIVSPEGGISFYAFQYHDAFATLFSMIDFPDNVANELDVHSVLSRGVQDAARIGSLTMQSVLDSINNIAISELETPLKKFHLLSSLSISRDIPFKRKCYDSFTFRITKDKYPKKHNTRNATIAQNDNMFNFEHPGYSKVIVTVKAKTYYGAASKALDCLDLIRSILCFYSNSEMTLLFGPDYLPINKVRTGQVHTLHNEDGSPATSNVWFEPNFVEAKIFNSPQFHVIKDNLFWFLDMLEKCNYKKVLIKTLLRFVRSLDEKDHNSALIQLWGVLENIVSPNEKNYNKISKRVSFLFKEPQYHKQVIEHLREYRNSTIHAGDQSRRAKSLCFQLQFYIRKIINFHITYSENFESLQQANNFLDFPSNPDALLKKYELIKSAIGYRGLEN